MASIDARLAGIEQAVKGLAKSIDDVVVGQRKDHDAMVVMTTEVRILTDKVNTIKSDRKEEKKSRVGRVWQALFIVLAASVGAAFSWLASKAKGEQ